MPRLPTGTVTFLFTDIEGFTRLLQQLSQDKYTEVLADHRRLFRVALKHYGGREVETQGDAFFCAFPRAKDALEAAIYAQRSIATHSWPHGIAVRVRMALHTGEPLSLEAGYTGIDVHRAARICAAGHGGQILVSQTTRELVANALPEGVSLRDLGEHRLKDISQPERVFQIVVAGLSIDFPLLKTLSTSSLAVLPLANLSGDPDQEYFSDGMTEALIADLAKVGALKVISRTSVMRYKGTRKPLREIAHELGVDAIVEGSVLRAGDEVRITAELVDASSDTHLWAESYNRKLTNILSLQGEVAHAITQHVKVKLTPQEDARLSEKRIVHPAAHEAYLRGRYHLNKATPAEVSKAITYFEDATQKDSSHALAYAGLATAYNYLGWLGGVAADVFPQAKRAALRALAIDEALAEAHAVLGYTATFFDWDWAIAEQELKRSIDLNPNYAEGYLNYSWLLHSQGRFEEARAAITRAGELDPLSLVIHANMANYFQFTRDYDGMLAQTKTTLELAPDLTLGLLFSGMAYWGKARFEDAVATFQKLVDLSGPGFKGYLGYSYARAGHENKALTILEELNQLAKREHVPSFQIALVWIGLERLHEAMNWLEKAFDERAGPWFPYIRQEALFDPLRNHPRFQVLVRRFNFSD